MNDKKKDGIDGKLSLKREKIAILGVRSDVKAGYVVYPPTKVPGPSCKEHCII